MLKLHDHDTFLKVIEKLEMVGTCDHKILLRYNIQLFWWMGEKTDLRDCLEHFNYDC